MTEEEKAQTRALYDAADDAQIQAELAKARFLAAAAESNANVHALRRKYDIPKDAYPSRGSLEWVRVIGQGPDGAPVEAPLDQEKSGGK